MPQVDVQWPSEDEDFDAKTENSSVKTATKPKPSITKMADDQSEAPAEEAAPAVTEETHEEPTPEETAPEAEAPAPADDQSNQPDPDPVVEQEAANLASAVDNDPGAVSEVPVASKRPKLPQMPAANLSLLRLVGEAVLVVAVIGLGLWSWSLSNDRKDLQSQVAKLNANPQSVVQKQTQQLITKVGSLMQLPTGETPTVAEVSDASQARQQSSFFANAQNGDRVLMYVKAGEAILYRPSTNKIVLVAPLVFTNNGTSTSSANKTTTTGTTSTATGSTATTKTNAKP